MAIACGGTVLVLLAAGSLARAETTVTGVGDEVLENVHAYLEIDDLDCDATPATVQRAFDRAPDQVRDSVAVFGFYDPVIETDFEAGDDCWQAVIEISAGEPVRLRDVDISITGQAAEHADFQRLRANTPLVTGAPLRHGEYDSFKRNLQDLARNRGFVEARFEESRLDIYPEELAADVAMHFESGPRYAFGQVTVEQEELARDFVDAFHQVEAGTPYDNRLLTSAFLDLNDSGYFEAVDVRAMPADPDSLTIPIEISLTPAPRRLVSYGIGYSTDTGPRLRFGRSIRRFNERGHRLSIDAQLSPVVSELTSTYRMPFGDPRFDWVSFSLGAKREETDTSLSRSIEGGVRRVVDRTRGWSQTQFISYIVEDFKVGTQTGRPHLLIPGVDWTRIRADDALRPTDGSRLSFELRAADDQVLSDTSFVQTIISAKWIHSFGGGGRVLLRARAGYMVEDDFSQLPPSVRFFAGGDQSVRGYDFKSLGPVDMNGDVIGGNRLLELSAEYEHPIKPRWSLAVFGDAGNAFEESNPEFRKGAGFGARWRSPLGPVRIDVAWPIDDIEHGAHLHVSLGPDF